MKQKCSFCERQLIYTASLCPCDENVRACSYCQNFGCYKCSKPFKKYQMKMCSICYSNVLQFKLFYINYKKICIDCCTKQLKRSKDMQVITIDMLTKVKKQQIQIFLNRFCMECKRKLSQQEIAKNKQNVCFICLNKKQTSSLQSQKISKDDKQGESRKLNYRQRLDNQNLVNQKSYKESEQDKKRLRDKWKNIQGNSYYIKCVSCNRAIFDSQKKAIITQQVAICDICSQFSKHQQKLIENMSQSRYIKNNHLQSNQQKAIKKDERSNNKIYQQPISQNIKNSNNQINQIQQIKNQKQRRSEQKQNQNKEIANQIKLNESVKRQMKNSRIGEGKMTQKKNRILKQPELKKSDSEAKLQNVLVQVQWVNDTDIIECSSCSIQIEAINSIWQQQQNKPLCRCCFAILLKQIEKQFSFKAPINLGQRNNKYMIEKRISSTAKKAENVIDQISTSYKQKYQEKKFFNNQPSKAKKQDQKLAQKIQKSREDLIRINSFNPEVKLNRMYDQPTFMKTELMQNIKKKTQQAQKAKQEIPTSEKNLTAAEKDGRGMTVKQNKINAENLMIKKTEQIKKRWTSSYKKPIFNAEANKSIRGQRDKYEPPKYNQQLAKQFCGQCGKFKGTTKEYKIGNKCVCVQCMGQNTQKRLKAARAQSQKMRYSNYV